MAGTLIHPPEEDTFLEQLYTSGFIPLIDDPDQDRQ
jgi:hypothetical protein